MYRKKMYCVQSIHTRKNEGGPLYAKLRALDGSRGTEGIVATSIIHQQTFSSWRTFFWSLQRVSYVVMSGGSGKNYKHATLYRTLRPWYTHVLTAFPLKKCRPSLTTCQPWLVLSRQVLDIGRRYDRWTIGQIKSRVSPKWYLQTLRRMFQIIEKRADNAKLQCIDWIHLQAE